MSENGSVTLDLTEDEAALLATVVGDFATDLRARKTPPKGWEYGRIQDALTNAASIINKMG